MFLIKFLGKSIQLLFERGTFKDMLAETRAASHDTHQEAMMPLRDSSTSAAVSLCWGSSTNSLRIKHTVLSDTRPSLHESKRHSRNNYIQIDLKIKTNTLNRMHIFSLSNHFHIKLLDKVYSQHFLRITVQNSVLLICLKHGGDCLHFPQIRCLIFTAVLKFCQGMQTCDFFSPFFREYEW